MSQINQFDKYFIQIDQAAFYERFTSFDEIGRGAGSIVYRARDNNLQSGYVAIKSYNKQQLRQYTRIDVIREIQILRSIKQENFTQYFLNLKDTFKIVYEGSYKAQYCLVMELCDMALEQLVNNRQDLLKIPETERIKMCLKIAKGVGFLHSINILHRDLKPDNILLNKTSESYDPFITDFGHSKENEVFMTSLRGTPLYVDPNLQRSQNYGFQWDIYSLGLILLKIMSGQFLINIPQRPTKDQFYRLMLPALQNLSQTLNVFKFNENVKQIIKNCLVKKRWKIQKVVEEFEAILNKMNEQAKISQKLTSEPVEQSEKEKNYIMSKSIVYIPQNMTKSLQVIKQGSVEFEKKSQSQFKKKNPQDSSKNVISEQFNQKEIFESKIKIKSVLSENYSSEIKSSIKKYSEMQIKSEQSIMLKQIKQISEVKIEKKTSKMQKNKTELMGKMFSARSALSNNLDTFNEQMQKLKVIQKFQERLQKIKEIEQSFINEQIKKQLITLAFIYLKMILKQHLKSIHNDEFMIKQINSFYQKVETLFQPLLESMRKNQFKMRESARRLLWGPTNADSNDVKKQFFQIVKSQCPLQKRRLEGSIS